jgi:transposase
VITVGMLAKIRRMHFRDRMSIREVARRTGLSRNTVRDWLRRGDVVEPAFRKRPVRSVVDPWAEALRTWLGADRHRPKRDRRTARVLFEQIKSLGYTGGYGRVCAFVRRFKSEDAASPGKTAYVPLVFAPGEAFQFDWSCEYAIIEGSRRRLEVAHVKLCASRAFWLVAYYAQSHEMLFEAHARAFEAFGGVPTRGIYDNMKTAVDRVGNAKDRTVNARFQAMCSHYLFEPEFCNRAAGWEKGIVEKNVQDRRRQIWQEVAARNWPSLTELNAWLGPRCRQAWETMRHPGAPARTIAEVWRDEQHSLMPNPRPFDAYVEQPARVSSTALVRFQRNRYSVPAEYAHRVVSLRVYPAEIVVVAEGETLARLVRSFERDRTFYDFRHYLGLLERKPGALRNGAPFADLPASLARLQRHLLKQPGGDRIMVQVLAAIPRAGLTAVTEAVERALAAGHPSGEHVLNLLSRLQSPQPETLHDGAGPPLTEAPMANVARYDELRAGVAGGEA